MFIMNVVNNECMEVVIRQVTYIIMTTPLCDLPTMFSTLKVFTFKLK